MGKYAKKGAVNAAFFAAGTALAFGFTFRGQDLGQIWEAAREMSPWGMLLSAALSLGFVAAEGGMIWYLLRVTGGGSGLGRCIAYSFIGFFFSGITPSATGGQPVQLYYMKKDGNSLSKSSVVLMTVAAVYKFVLAAAGILILAGWNRPLRRCLRGYYPLYLLGLSLNVLLTALLLAVMLFPGVVWKIMLAGEGLAVKCRILRADRGRRERIGKFIGSYRETVSFLRAHKGAVGAVVAGTFLQRSMVFLLTPVAYRGLGLSGTSPFILLLLQASIYIAVDMLPVPGAQGITEAMYQAVFGGIFPGKYLAASLCFTRGASFYLVMAVSGAVTAARWAFYKER